ncbi:MAG TPA: tRNA pseudouridine(55) synthase TruB [Bryobacterales bacterium]|nr:tRNA pseudouridine(55) synthase TruB [Bryobacterales bacterium]
MDGILVVDKPAGITSHDVVNRVRRLARIQRVGHLGTLDPIATGVLPLALGRATRLAQFFLHREKTYEAVIRFGFATDTYDSAGLPAGPDVPVALSAERLEELLAGYRGEFDQIPPPISAKKVNGVAAYKLARKLRPVELEPVRVRVDEFTLLGVEGSRAKVRIRCSAGTYLRALAHDMGQKIGTGAHVENLRRLAAGEFTLDMAHTLEQIRDLAAQNRLEEALIRGADLLPEAPAEQVDAITAAQILHGRDFRVSPFRVRPGSRLVKAIDMQGRLLAIGEVKLPNLYHPIVVL